MAVETRTRSAADTAIEMAKGHFMVMRIMHLALAAGIILFGAVALMLTHKRMTFSPALDNPLVLVAGIMTVTTILVASVLHLVFFRSGPAPVNVHTAVQRYQTFVLVRVAVIEGAALLSAVALLATSNVLPAGLLALCTIAMVVRSPSHQEFMSLTEKMRRQREKEQ